MEKGKSPPVRRLELYKLNNWEHTLIAVQRATSSHLWGVSIYADK